MKRDPDRQQKTFCVLFVCSGNTCRSPMAEGILKHLLPPEYRDKIAVQSAGTLGLWGMPASELAVEVAAEHGIDLTAHRSQGLTRTLLSQCDLVLCMAREHEEFIRYRFPSFREQTFLLKNFDQPKKRRRKADIEDPIGRDRETYEKVFREIYSEVRRILPRILQLADKKFAMVEQNSGSADQGEKSE